MGMPAKIPTEPNSSELDRKLRALWDRAESIKIHLARTNLTDFCEYVFGWDVQPFQREWHKDFRDEKRLLIFASVEHGKSSHVVADCLYRIGNDPNIRIAYISNIAQQAQKFFGVIREIIEGDSESAKRYRKVFPHIKPSTGIYRKWDSEGIIVERSQVMPDFTMIAIGVGKSFLGARYDLIIFDDILDFENTATEGQRDKLWRWLTSTALTRVVKDGSAIFICTAWNPEDAAHRCENSGEWTTRRVRAIGILPNGDPDWTSKIAWPTSWPVERLRAKFREVGSIEFARQFLCVATGDAMSRFKESAFEFALDRGKAFSITESYGHKPGENWPVLFGVDLSIKKSQDNDLAAIFVGCIGPDGTRRLLTVRMGHYDGGDILDELARARVDFPRVMGAYVEDNGAQAYLLQFARGRIDLPPLHGFTTDERKYDPVYGIPSLSVEFDNGMWILPSLERQDGGQLHEKVRHLIAGLRGWSPRDHTKDDVMAMWFFREACADIYGRKIETGGERYDFSTPQHSKFFPSTRPQNASRFFGA